MHRVGSKVNSGKWPLFVCLLLSVYLLRGIALCCIVPPLEMWDEYQHVAYLQFLHEQGRPPVLGHDAVPASLIPAIVELPQSRDALAQLFGSGARDYDAYWAGQPGVVSVGWQPPLLYEARQAPLYYQLMSPVFQKAGGIAHLSQAVCALRTVNLLLTTVALAVVLQWLGSVCTDARFAVLIGLWVVLQPMFLLNAVRVANDSLAVLMGCVSTVLCLRLSSRHIFWQSAALGMLVGVGILVKTSNAALLALGVVSLAVLVIRGSLPLLQALTAVGLLLLTTGIVAESYLRAQWQTFPLLAQGHWFEAMALFFNVNMWAGLIDGWFITSGLWVGGWSFSLPMPILVTAYKYLFCLAGLGWVVAWLFHRAPRRAADVFINPWVTPNALAVVAVMLGGMMVWTIQAIIGGGSSTMPWDAAVALPWLMILLARGALAYRHSRLGYVVAVCGPALFILAEADGVALRMVRAYSGQTLSASALQRVASLHPALWGVNTLAIAMVLYLILVIIIASMLRSMTKPVATMRVKRRHRNLASTLTAEALMNHR